MQQTRKYGHLLLFHWVLNHTQGISLLQHINWRDHYVTQCSLQQGHISFLGTSTTTTNYNQLCTSHFWQLLLAMTQPTLLPTPTQVTIDHFTTLQSPTTSYHQPSTLTICTSPATKSSSVAPHNMPPLSIQPPTPLPKKIHIRSLHHDSSQPPLSHSDRLWRPPSHFNAFEMGSPILTTYLDQHDYNKVSCPITQTPNKIKSFTYNNPQHPITQQLTLVHRHYWAWSPTRCPILQLGISYKDWLFHSQINQPEYHIVPPSQNTTSTPDYPKWDLNPTSPPSSSLCLPDN